MFDKLRLHFIAVVFHFKMNEFVVCLFFVVAFFVKTDSPGQKKHPLDDLFLEEMCSSRKMFTREKWIVGWLLWIILDFPDSRRLILGSLVGWCNELDEWRRRCFKERMASNRRGVLFEIKTSVVTRVTDLPPPKCNSKSHWQKWWLEDHPASSSKGSWNQHRAVKGITSGNAPCGRMDVVSQNSMALQKVSGCCFGNSSWPASLWKSSPLAMIFCPSNHGYVGRFASRRETLEFSKKWPKNPGDFLFLFRVFNITTVYTNPFQKIFPC